jgi:hypothetical protein
MASTLAPLDRARRALDLARTVPDLVAVDAQLAAVAQLARRMRLALGEQNKVAMLRVECAAKAGAVLARSVRRGRRPKGDLGSRLPEGITRKQSSRWQAVARVPKRTREQYGAWCDREEVEVTFDGLHRYAAGQVHFASARTDWSSPPAVVERVVTLLGRVDLDPCSGATATVPARRRLTAEDDGLAQRWRGRVFLNPPYGAELPQWVDKLVAEHRSGRVAEAVALLPARTDTAWFRALREYPRCFLFGRLRFGGAESAAPFPSMLVYLGQRVHEFAEAFADAGDVYVLAR